MSKINIGFVGVGIMGKHIANYLLKVSDNFFIVQRNTENTRSFIKALPMVLMILFYTLITR